MSVTDVLVCWKGVYFVAESAVRHVVPGSVVGDGLVDLCDGGSVDVVGLEHVVVDVVREDEE